MIASVLQDISHLFFPEFCSSCHNALVKGEPVICTVCLNNLPRTGYAMNDKNAVAEKFWGKFPIQSAYALFSFDKGGKVQRLMHAFKYRGNKEIGYLCGELCGLDIKKFMISDSIDVIIPVPLHASKERMRGFNQSATLAEGIAKILKKPALLNTLLRSVPTDTQTKKQRYSRYENMKDVFTIKHKTELYNKHILLVDDVITTGSTISSCAEVLIQQTNSRVSVASMAFAAK